jgi:hypothetical protein
MIMNRCLIRIDDHLSKFLPVSLHCIYEGIGPISAFHLMYCFVNMSFLIYIFDIL